MSLSHIEILSEALVSAPPVGVDHGDSLVSSDLMEVGVSNVILLPIDWETSIGVRVIVVLIDLTNVPLPLGHHALLLLLCQKVEDEGLIEMEDEENPDDSNSILVCKGGKLPEGVSEWVLEESSNVFEGSPLLSHVSWLTGFGNELHEVTIGLLGEGSI